jgi:hypothetical protein
LPGFPSTTPLTYQFGTLGATRMYVMTAIAAILIYKAQRAETFFGDNSRRLVMRDEDESLYYL